jgi:hypothetical protein
VGKDILAAFQSGRAAGDKESFIETGARFRHRGGFGIEIDVIGHEQVEQAVAIIIEEGAIRAPAMLSVAGIGGDSGLRGHVGRRSVTVVVPQ